MKKKAESKGRPQAKKQPKESPVRFMKKLLARQSKLTARAKKTQKQEEQVDRNKTEKWLPSRSPSP